MSALVFRYPDPKLPYILDTDASAVGVGAVLSQIQEAILQRDVGSLRKELLCHSWRTAGGGKDSEAFQALPVRHQI